MSNEGHDIIKMSHVTLLDSTATIRGKKREIRTKLRKKSILSQIIKITGKILSSKMRLKCR
jgi:hypothetical protein